MRASDLWLTASALFAYGVQLLEELKEEKQNRWKMEDDLSKAMEANRKLREMLEEKKTQLKEVCFSSAVTRVVLLEARFRHELMCKGHC